jgi:hypothetical protein
VKCGGLKYARLAGRRKAQRSEPVRRLGDTETPQWTQCFQVTSSSVSHSTQCRIVRFCPHWGQKLTTRPDGKVAPQRLQPETVLWDGWISGLLRLRFRGVLGSGALGEFLGANLRSGGSKTLSTATGSSRIVAVSYC